jgi:leucyl/phenylalanyl-tRNA--protein transferase
MFFSDRDASKVALAHLVNGLNQGGFLLLDMQNLSSHLASLGAIGIPRPQYQLLLSQAVRRKAAWPTPANTV